MSQIPLPPRACELLDFQGGTNRSLLFDRAFPSHDGDSRPRDRGDSGEPKRDFLGTFVRQFPITGSPGHPSSEFEAFLDRRHQVFERLGARAVDRTTASRLIVGLGLPHPVDTGFLFDRLTGSPYLPASSVKGLLRAAARRVAAGDLEIDEEACDEAEVRSAAQDFWRRNLESLFGPELTPGASPARGQLAVYDAFPRSWPCLELDVLTPHQGDYYLEGSKSEPADWHQPVPVTFLAVAPGTGFRFYLRTLAAGTELHLAHVEALLKTALDWLGAGSKTSSGYGVFASADGGNETPAAASTASEATGPSPQPPKTVIWPEATVSWVRNERRLEAAYQGEKADTRERSLLDALPEAARSHLTQSKKRKTLVCEVTVRQLGERWFEIVSLRMRS